MQQLLLHASAEKDGAIDENQPQAPDQFEALDEAVTGRAP